MSEQISVLNPGSCPVSHLSATEYFLPDDLLIVERLRKEIDKHISFKLEYEDLKTRLISDICARISCIRSMAYMDDIYAPLNHSHDYSLVEIFPHCPAKNDAGEDNIHLGTFGLWKYNPVTSAYVENMIPIYQPTQHVGNLETNYTVGEIVFTGWKQYPTAATSNPRLVTVNGSEMLYDSQSNGYWVYPHGQTITCGADEFTEACALYGNGTASTSFTVPNLTGFVKLNPGTQRTNSMQQIPYHNQLSAHSHVVSTNTSDPKVQFTIKLEQNYSEKGDTIYRLHCSSLAERNSECKHQLTWNIELINLSLNDSTTTINETGDNLETYPSHMVLPVILYIGEK